MYPNFFALFNKAGIACAADADHTIFRLSKTLPVAVAINPDSSIPWEKIFHDYQQTDTVRECISMLEYAEDFSSFLATVPVKKGWASLPSGERNLIFLGFGSQDIFPSVYDVLAEIRDGALSLGEGQAERIGEDDRDVFFNYLGNFDSVSTLIHGASSQVQSFFYDKYLELFRIYEERVRERFKGTEFEDYVNKHLERYDAEKEIYSNLNKVTVNAFSAFEMGVDSFSIEDMVTAVETLVKSNAELMRLRDGAAVPAEVKEIAVLTIPEGLTWIKHSLYYRRNEI